MTKSKRKRLKIKLLNKINSIPSEEIKQKPHVWNIIKQKYPRVNKKKRRHSGRKYPKFFYSTKLLEENMIDPNSFMYWDEWNNYWDGYRDKSHLTNPKLFSYEDDKEEAIARNKKLKKQIKIREARKKSNLN